jgi:flagellar assembly factor FliW
MLHEPTRVALSVAGGLVGFPDSERYALDEIPGGGPLFRLTSLDEPGLEFLVAPPALFFPEYEPVIDDTSAARLGLHGSEDALLLVLLTVGASAAEATANLLAPLVVNQRDGRAAQVVADGEHSLRAPLRP